MTIHTSKLKLEIEFQNGGRSFSKTTSSFISAVKNRYDIITPPPIVRLLRNLAGRCKITL